MLVELGNHAPLNADHGQRAVTYVNIPDSYSLKKGLDAADFRAHLGDSLLERGGVTRLPEHEAALVVTHPDGVWKKHSSEKPAWVWSDNAELQRFLSDFYGCPVGRPDGLEDNYYTRFGPPGVGPWANPVNALLTNAGRDLWAGMLGGGLVGTTGTATATSATSLTASTAWTTNQWAGKRVYAGAAFGNVISNTATVLTIDQWYNPAAPGGAAQTTPGGTSTFIIADGSSTSAWFMGITANSTAPAQTDTSLAGEITTAGGGLIRKICPFAHTAGTNTYTLTPVFTANGTDTLPVTIAKMGTFVSLIASDVTDTMFHEDLISPTATLSASGDNLTISLTVTGT